MYNIHFETLGCKLNQIESEALARSFADEGFSIDLEPITAAKNEDANTLLCIYSIKDDFTVDYSYNANTDIPMLTPPDKYLKITDIYYLIRSRVFQDNPYTTPMELERLGLTEYNPYEIILKTYGILPADAYWIKRSDDKSSFDDAIAKYNKIMFGIQPPGPDSRIEDFLG